MKICKLLLALAVVAVLVTPSYAAPFLAWDAPTTNTDGSPLTNLANYKVYRCNDTATVCDKTNFAAMIATVPAGTTIFDISPFTTQHMFFVTAVNTTGQESAESNCIKASNASPPGAVACFPPPPTTTPNAPPNMRVQ